MENLAGVKGRSESVESEMVLVVLVAVVVVVATLIVAVLAHAGYFSDLRIRTSIPASLPSRVAYTVHQGPYRNVGSRLERLASLAPGQTRFCAFYDDPKQVRAQSLRLLRAFCILWGSIPKKHYHI